MILFRLLLYRNLELKRLEKNFGETEKKTKDDDHFTDPPKFYKLYHMTLYEAFVMDVMIDE